jgi:hypothetical protein
MIHPLYLWVISVVLWSRCAFVELWLSTMVVVAGADAVVSVMSSPAQRELLSDGYLRLVLRHAGPIGWKSTIPVCFP